MKSLKHKTILIFCMLTVFSIMKTNNVNGQFWNEIYEFEETTNAIDLIQASNQGFVVLNQNSESEIGLLKINSHGQVLENVVVQIEAIKSHN